MDWEGQGKKTSGARPRRLERWSPLLLLEATAAFYLARLGAAGLYDPNEGRYAEIPREMLLLRDWLTPHFNFIRYFEKPPLLYWLTALAYQLLGVSEFSARLVTALAAIGGVGVTYGIGKDLWGRRAGLLSGLILATSFGYFIFSRIILTDMLFTALLAAAFWAALRGLLDEPPRRGTMLLAYAATGLAILTKGLIGLAFPALTVGGFLLLTRDRRLLRRLDPLRGSAVFLAVTAPWHLLAGRLWGDEVAPRSRQETTRGLSYSCFGLLTIVVGLLPASWLFPRLGGGRLYNAMFAAMDAHAREIQSGILYNAKLYTIPPLQELVPILHWVTLILLLGFTGATFAWLRRRPALTFACLVAGMLPTFAFIQTGIILFEPHRSVVHLADAVRLEFRPGQELIVEGPYEIFAGANFYTGQRARVLHGHFGDLEFGSQYPEAAGTFLGEGEFADQWRGTTRVYLLSDSPSRLGKLRALGPEPVVLGRSGKNWLFSNRTRN